ncbi:electron transport complex subunit RsxC [Vibrio ulleungensis]|uniref:Ion-translocating oxidoreductase complex subunit C n=1 Tax=Vibrio ulleungensis TaxID=2807619 RepID=A0ABS2HJL6_9VIBR|nr:electron transport complex subunit RsxC [Vibrio ulleungensis]MBM7036712.1 electron transport complex subunit RsxC [Vibrio ulleungensis]
MNNTLLHVIEQGRLWDFHGGVHPTQNKQQSNQSPIGRLAASDHVVIPIKQHIGKAGELLVSVGDDVLKGQPLTRYTSGLMLPVHATVSGTVIAIEQRTIAHPSGLMDMCVIIENDHQERWIEREPCPDYTTLDQQVLIDKIRSAGVSGLGGAGFPTARKIESAMAKTKVLIINAAECEPYITADDTLMREHANEIIGGIDIVTHLLSPELVIIGIEDNKPEAISALEKAAVESDLVIRVIPTKYPSGGEKQLIEILTGMQVPSKGIPADIGVVMHNVGSMFAIQQAVVNGSPLVERVVTVTGKAFPKPQNYWIPLGTSIRTVVEKLNYQPAPKQKLIMGGPMMGFALPHLDIPISKATNCLLGPTVKELAQQEQELACIRCGQCAEVCPARLLPQELQWHAKDSNLDKCEELNINDCIECGACAFVCPSNIPLVHYYRQAKSEIRIQRIEVESAERAKQRFEDRKLRLERDKQEREEKHRKAAEARKQAAAQSGGDDAIAAAIARVKGKQDAATTTEKKPAVAAAIARAKAKQAEAQAQNSDRPDNSEMMKLREERKQQARQKRADKATTGGNDGDNNSSSSSNDAVAAAVARAKARKAAQKDGEATADNSTTKAANPAVAAAVARAKARKAAQSDTNQQVAESDKVAAATDTANKPDKKDAVAAAVARAKTRKAAQTDASQQVAESDKDLAASDSANKADKKDAVAAAVARAKARKAAQADASQQVAESDKDLAASDSANKADKKDAVAAAVARAKARKAAQADANQQVTESDKDLAASNSANKDDKKDEVAAAVARAKARKAAQSDANQQVTESDKGLAPSDSANKADKKDAVAAAVARAKARKAAQADANPQVTDSQIDTASKDSDNETNKQAAVAAAVARAKARKLAKQQKDES